MGKVTNKEILKRTGLPCMEDLLIRKNLRWTGHLMRMSPDRLPKQVLYSQLSSGHRKRGRPRLRFKDTIKRNLKLRDIKTDSWTSLSQQRVLYMESNSQVMAAVFVASRPIAWWWWHIFTELRTDAALRVMPGWSHRHIPYYNACLSNI